MNVYPRHNINLNEELILAAKRILHSQQAFYGPDLKKFQSSLAKFIGVENLLCLSSARIGLYLLLKACNFNSSDEVILPAYNFFVIPFIVKLLGLKAVFVDINPLTHNIDVNLIEEKITSRTRMVIVTHMCGCPAPMHDIMSLASKYNIMAVEDCTHALGAEYNGQQVGNFGNASIFSFGMGKMLFCYGGGAIVVKDSSLFNRVKELYSGLSTPNIRQLKKEVWRFRIIYCLTMPGLFKWSLYPFLRISDRLGFNLLDKVGREPLFDNLNFLVSSGKKMSNFQAAVGLVSLKHVNHFIEKCRSNAIRLNSLLAGLNQLILPLEDSGSKHAYLYYSLQLKGGNRDRLRKLLLRQGVDTKISGMSDCSRMEFLKENGCYCPVAEDVSRRTLCIPNGALLSKQDMAYIAEKIKNSLNYLNL